MDQVELSFIMSYLFASAASYLTGCLLSILLSPHALSSLLLIDINVEFFIENKKKRATFFSDVPASGVYFTTYEVIQRALKKEDGSLSLMSTITAGGCAGITNWIVGMPPDVLKSRLQTGMYRSSFQK